LPDAGVIRMNGQELTLRTPLEARRAGVAVIYQEFSLVPGLTAAENIFLGREPTRGGFIRPGEELRPAAELFRRLGAAIDPGTPCRELTVAQQQAVEVAKALAGDARILVMDEPSATLTPQEVERLFAVIRDLKAHGIGVIYVSHRLAEIFAIADRVLVLRDGQRVGTYPIGGVNHDRLIRLMVGCRLEQEFPPPQVPIGGPRLVVQGLCRGSRVRDVSIAIRRGEVLGLTGLVGAGRTETARLIFGADPLDAGTIALDGKPLTIARPRDAIRAGIALLTE